MQRHQHVALQRSLFTQLPVPIAFPWLTVIVVLLCSIACAMLSSFFPARALARKPIAAVLKAV